MNYIIRADASSEIGTGHIMRCIALGQMLQDEGNEISFITQTENENIIQRLKRERFEVIKLSGDLSLKEDADKTCEIAFKKKAKWIITDGYKFITEYQKVVKENQFYLMCIDDIAGCHYISDVVLNQNLNAEKIFNYSCEPYTKLLLGIEYVLLRREFRQLKNWKRDKKSKYNKILLTLGGSDPDNYTLKVLKALERLEVPDLEIAVLIGSGYKESAALNNYINNSTKKIVVHQNIENVIPLMQWCDLAISAAGSTVWELIKLHTPIITGIIAKNQEPVAEALEKNNLGANLNWFENISVEELAKILKKAITDIGLMNSFSVTASKFESLFSHNLIKYLGFSKKNES